MILAKKLLLEANQRLKKGVETTIFSEIELGQATLAGVSKIEKERDQEIKEAEVLQKKINKTSKKKTSQVKHSSFIVYIGI